MRGDVADFSFGLTVFFFLSLKDFEGRFSLKHFGGIEPKAGRLGGGESGEVRGSFGEVGVVLSVSVGEIELKGFSDHISVV